MLCIAALEELKVKRGEVPQESHRPPATGAHERDAAQGKNPMPEGQAIPALHFQTTSCRGLYPVPKHNQETCAEDDLF